LAGVVQDERHSTSTVTAYCTETEMRFCRFGTQSAISSSLMCAVIIVD